MQCRNYMQQYSRTKSIRQINKTRSSYKQLIQNPKTRDNSNGHNNLKLSAQKKGSEKLNNNPTASTHADYHPQSCFNTQQPTKKNEAPFLLTNTQNLNNISNISYGKLNNKMKLKVNTDKSIRSMSSHEQLKQHNSFIGSSMANIGVGLGSHKKKPKLVTLTANSSQVHTTSKKQKNYNQIMSVSRLDNQKSNSIPKHHQNSVVSSKYSTNVVHQTVYQSIKRQTQNANLQLITLNTSLLLGKDNQNENKKDLEQIYIRVRSILEANVQKQKEWEIERSYYKTKIKQLEKQLQDAGRKSLNMKPTKTVHGQTSNYSSINLFGCEQAIPTQKHSNRKVNNNHR